MASIFETVLNMSMTASVVILAVLLVRVLMKKAPRKFCYLLWLVVAFRLVVPFSFESSISIFNLGGDMPVVEIPQTGTLEELPRETPEVSEELPEEAPSSPEVIIPGDTETSRPAENPPETENSYPAPEVSAPTVEPPAVSNPETEEPQLPDWVIPGITNPGNTETSRPPEDVPGNETSLPGTTLPDTEVSAPATDVPVAPPVSSPVAAPASVSVVSMVLTAIWLAGILALLGYSLVSYIKLKRRLSTAVLLEGNVYGSDRIDAPFALGFARPRIYIPFGLSDSAKEYVLAHERYHLKRLDHIVKPLSFGILAVHWFNPLCWIAFNRMSLDMELSCDEKVLQRYGDETMKKQYTKTLLDFATSKQFPSPAPLSFSEGASAKTRIKNALYWKKPKLWLSVVALVLSLVILVACAGNAITSGGEESTPTPETENGIFTFEETPYQFTFVSNGDGTCVITEVYTDFYHKDNYDLVIPATSPDGDKVVEVDLNGMNTFEELIVPPYLLPETMETLADTIANSDTEHAERDSKTFKSFYIYYAEMVTKGGAYPAPGSEYYKLAPELDFAEMERLVNILKSCTDYTEEQCFADVLAFIEDKEQQWDWESDEALEEFKKASVSFFYRNTRRIDKVVLPAADVKVHQGFLGLSYVLADGTAVTPVYENPVTLEIVTAEEAQNVLTLDEDGNEVIAFTSSRPVKDFHILTIDMADSVTAEPHPKGDSIFYHKAFTESYKLLLGENIPTRGISFIGEDGKTYQYAICCVGSDGSYELVPLNVLEPIDGIDTPFSVEIVPIEDVGSEHIYTAMTPYSTYGNSVIYRVTANILIEDVFISRFERDGQDPQLGSIFAHYTPDQVSEDPDNPEIQLKPVAAKESFYVRAPRPDETQTWGLFFDVPALGENYMVCYAVFMNENGSYRIAEMEYLTDSDVPGAHYVVKQEKPQAPALDYASMKVLRTIKGNLFVLEDPDAPDSQRHVLVLKKNGRYTELHRDYNLITGYYDMSEAEILAFNNFEREATAKAYLCFTDTGDKKEINLSALPEDETISHMKWLDPNHLLFVSQLDHGTIVEGGELWCYTTNDGSVQKLISIADPRLQIKSVNVSSTTLTVKAVYFDEAYNFTEPMNFQLRIGTVNDRISKGEVFRLSPESGLSLYAATSEEIANNTFINVTPGASVTNKYVLANDGSYAYAFFCSYKAVGESNNGWMYEYTDTSSRIYLNGYANVYVEASASTSITNTWGYCIGDRYYALMDDYRDGTQKFVEITDQVTGPGLPEDLSTLFGDTTEYREGYRQVVYGSFIVVHIYDWDQYFVLEEAMKLDVAGDTALGFYNVESEESYYYYPGVYRFEKGKAEPTKTVIDVPEVHAAYYTYHPVTEKTGYLMVFGIRDNGSGTEYLAQVLKTTDGGLTWEQVDKSGFPTGGTSHDPINYSTFLTEDFGVIAFLCNFDTDLAGHVYYTTDGGVSWRCMTGLDNLPRDPDEEWNLRGITLENGVYTIKIDAQGYDQYIYFTSTDLENWEPVPQVLLSDATDEQIADTENYTHFYDPKVDVEYKGYNAHLLVQVFAPIESFRFEALTEDGLEYIRETLYETNLVPGQPVIIHTYINDVIPICGYSYLNENGVRVYKELSSSMK